jgi:sulfur-oxidizing protein SoxX
VTKTNRNLRPFTLKGFTMSNIKVIQIFVSVASLLLIACTGCTPAPASGKGFTLPDGDRDRGEQTFVDLNCHHCHTVAATDLPVIDSREMAIRLGGEVSRIGTYGELVTAIINPSHRLAKGHFLEDISEDGQSLMKNYNDVMTVSQLIDIVAFLQSRYKVRHYEPTAYPMYY